LFESLNKGVQMGCSYHVKCLQCDNNFDVNSGGGFFFHLLHCDLCGKDKSIGFDEIGELHLRYIKGLPGPYCVASSSLDQHIKDNYPGEPMSEGGIPRRGGADRCSL